MAVSVAEEAIALLLDLAERGEIDPWDVQVIEVIDRFLAHLTPSSRDLLESGQAFLYAAMLVYLKAMALAEPDLDQAEDPGPLEELVPDQISRTLTPRQLDQILQPRAVPRIHRTRPITLRELIHHLQELESTLQERPPGSKTPPKRVTRQQALAAITQLAHPENLLETTAALESLLAQIWQRGIQRIGFDDLLALVKQAAVQQTGVNQTQDPHAPHRIQVFWSLLLMASRSQVDLIQETFYGDLTIVPSPAVGVIDP
jgi:segregation and condensation protein A